MAVSTVGTCPGKLGPLSLVIMIWTFSLDFAGESFNSFHTKNLTETNLVYNSNSDMAQSSLFVSSLQGHTGFHGRLLNSYWS